MREELACSLDLGRGSPKQPQVLCPLPLTGTIKAGSQGLPHPLSWSGLPGWASLTNAVVPHVMITIITLLPRLQDAIPTGAMLVYGVTHRVERGQLAKETHSH